MSAEFHHERRPAWRVVRAIAAELKRQQLAHGPVDQQGRLGLYGYVDLAMLAHITEAALRQEFGE